MGFVFTDGKNNYLARSRNGFHPVSTVFAASIWETEQKARNLYAMVPPVLKKQGYHLEAIDLNPRPAAEQPKPEERNLTPAAVTWQALPLASCGVPEVEAYVQKITTMVQTMADVQKMVRTCKDEVAKQERIQQDILHKIEFESGHAGVGLKMYSDLRHCRRRRRAFKDLMAVLTGVKGMLPEEVSVGYLEKKQAELSDRLYSPRSEEVFNQ